MTTKTRLKKIEQAQGIGEKKKYICVVTPDWANWDTPEEKAKGYKIQPYTKEAGGTGGKDFYLATKAELDAFAARPDVDIHIIRVIRASEDIKDGDE